MRRPCLGRGVRRLQTSFRFGLALILFSCALAAHAQTEPKPMYFDFTPLAGYRTSVSFTTQPVEGIDVPKIVIDPSPSYGAAFGGRVSDLDVIELRWTRMNTTMRVEQNFLTTFQQKVIVDQYHGDFTHEYVPDFWPVKIRPYIMASVGATHVSGSATRNFTRFSIGVGAGVKVFATRHVGFRVQGEWVPILVSPEVGFICGGGCIIRIRTQLSSQGEFAAGPLFRF
jgi:hypothetical protein